MPPVIVGPQDEPRDRVIEAAPPALPKHEPAQVTTQAEGGLRSEAEDIEQQARGSRPPEEGANLLEPAPEE